MCGATNLRLSLQELHQGLSPRVRGNPSSEGARKAPVGPIPACAGQPSRHTCEPDSERAYPRVCGATLDVGVSCWHRGGLSPRVRGNPIPGDLDQATLGPIPACAGQPFRGRIATPSVVAYPRVCGATSVWGYEQTNVTGLSPRVRGNHDGSGLGPFVPGPIPACAGQPQKSRPRPWG